MAGVFAGALPKSTFVRAQVAGEPIYPTFVIHLLGGLDGPMHWDAKPSSVGLSNRNVSPVDIATTSFGLPYYKETMKAVDGWDDILEQSCLVRNLRGHGTHYADYGMLWTGRPPVGTSDAGDETVSKDSVPWANYQQAEYIKAGREPVLPPLAAHFTARQRQRNPTIYNNRTSVSGASTLRVELIRDLSESLTGNNPTMTEYEKIAFRELSFVGKDKYDSCLQEKSVVPYEDSFREINRRLDLNLPGGAFWPPFLGDANQALLEQRFEISNPDKVDVRGDQPLGYYLAMAFDLAKKDLCKNFFISAASGYDTHNRHDSRQRAAADTYLAPVGRFIKTLMDTPSPLESGKTMFDTSHIVVGSDVGRTPGKETLENMNPAGDGTGHWPYQSALVCGGRFKRGAGFGAADNQLRGTQANFVDGSPDSNALLPTVADVLTTVMKANKVDYSSWKTLDNKVALPIDALLDESKF